MTKALLRKQLLEIFSWVYKNNKTGKRRSLKGVVGYILLYIGLFGFLSVVFGVCGTMLCEPLCDAGMGWFYWCLMSLLALFFGVFGSVFNTYGTLYMAKDNDFLLSMPVPISKILIARLSGVYAMGLMYELIVMIPAVIVWLWKARVAVLGVIFTLLLPVVLSVHVLVLSAVLGWVVAMIASRLKHKNIITVLISLAFIAVYYFVCGQASNALQVLLQEPERIGARMKWICIMLYHLGRAAEGRVLSMGIATALTAVLLLLTYWVLKKSFLKLATANNGSAKAAYWEKAVRIKSVDAALLQKELRRFTGSSNYMLNCGLGTVFLPLAAVMLLLKHQELNSVCELLPRELLPMLALSAACMLSTMNDLTAASVSLEGKNLWLLQSLPVSGRTVLKAKLRLHACLTIPPVALLIAAIAWMIKLTVLETVLVFANGCLFVLMMGALGLMLNLRLPNLSWTNELVPVKQGMPVFIALFGGWILTAVLAGLYYMLSRIAPVNCCFLVCLLLLLVAWRWMCRWLNTKGTEILGTLS